RGRHASSVRALRGRLRLLGNRGRTARESASARDVALRGVLRRARHRRGRTAARRGDLVGGRDVRPGRGHARADPFLRDRGEAMVELIVASLPLAIIAATPLLLAVEGELVVQRSGIINLGIEGMM